jgi:hypothetical protein
MPGLLAADWAVAAIVPADWADRSRSLPSEPTVAYTSWRAPDPVRLPEVTPLRARPVVGPDDTRYAVAPFGRAGLVMVLARTDDELPAAGFHITEVDRVAQLVRAAAVILGDRLDGVGVPAVAAVIEPS